MTEQEWLCSDHLWQMLHFLYESGRFTARKQFLYCVASCRLRGDGLPREYEQVLRAVERFADHPGLVSEPANERFYLPSHPAMRLGTYTFEADLRHLQEQGRAIVERRYAAILKPREAPPWDGDPRFEADDAVANALAGDTFACSLFDATGSIARCRPGADVLRDLFGNVFRPVTLDSGWTTEDVSGLVRAIDEDRAFDRLPILADALIDAGCDNVDILDHCRSSGPHVRGCWVVDLLTGRS